MSNLPFEVIQFSGREEHSKSFAPTESAARKIAKWWCDKSPINRATVRNTVTGVSENFGNEQGEVISETGEILEECPGCAERDSVIAELMKQQKSDKLKYAKLLKEKSDEAEDSPEWQDTVFIFDFWKRTCNHPNSKLDLPRYRDSLPFLRSEGIELCMRAVAGAAFAAGTQDMKSGATAKYDDWNLIFRNRSKFESFCNRAPKDWKTIYGVEL